MDNYEIPYSLAFTLKTERKVQEAEQGAYADKEPKNQENLVYGTEA